jgi:hypothetical protein
VEKPGQFSAKINSWQPRSGIAHRGHHPGGLRLHPVEKPPDLAAQPLDGRFDPACRCSSASVRASRASSRGAIASSSRSGFISAILLPHHHVGILANLRANTAGYFMSDRLALAHAFEDAGMARDKAEHVATVVLDAIHDNVARKADLQALEQKITSDLALAVRDLKIWTGGVLTAGLTVQLALVGLLMRYFAHAP